ncbi:O-antigen ligase family protein [Thermus caldilimi]|uniref:O-antigen ligase family protein n=1 Tax=Thermus caldilimi TaxID=2483360 RepID=UPI001075DDC6|nr:O-antigen ligase family protein [Thermus caldilimi]
MILKHLWPLFAFLYPFAVFPGLPTHPGVVLVKHAFVLAFLLVGAFLEMLAHPQARLRDLLLLSRRLRAQPALALLLALALVMVLAALLSPERAVALTGSLADYTDGLGWGLMMLGVALLVYLRAREEPEAPRRVAQGLVLGGSLLSLLALWEVLTGRPIFYPLASPADLPTVTFPQKGHLSGYFVLAAGAALGLRSPWGLFLGALGVGLAFNRAGLLALGLLAFLALLRAPRYGLVAALSLALGVGAGMAVVRLSAQGPVQGGGAVRQVADASTFLNRLFYWKAALGGIAARPFLGWGGGVFEHRWPAHLSPEDLEAFLRAEFGYRDARLVEVANAPESDPVFLLRQPNGDLVVLRVYSFRAHNQFLEVALKWGLLGLGLYLALLFLALRGLPQLHPAATGLFALHVFFLFWFAIPEGEGALWALWGAALGQGALAWGRVGLGRGG